MSIREAAIQTLREANQPLMAHEITERILKHGLWQTQGKTPVATVAACLYTDIKKSSDTSPFVLVAAQTFGLRELGAQPFPGKKSSSDHENKMTGSKPVTTFSFTDAAEKVLEQFGQKKPMHYRAVTEKALSLGWLETAGKTPEASMYAQVLTEIRRYQKRGEQPRFVQHGRGYVGLPRWMGKGLAFEIEQHNKRVRQALHKRLLSIDPTEFEELIARLLAEIGFEDIRGHTTKR